MTLFPLVALPLSAYIVVAAYMLIAWMGRRTPKLMLLVLSSNAFGLMGASHIVLRHVEQPMLITQALAFGLILGVLPQWANHTLPMKYWQQGVLGVLSAVGWVHMLVSGLVHMGAVFALFMGVLLFVSACTMFGAMGSKRFRDGVMAEVKGSIPDIKA